MSSRVVKIHKAQIPINLSDRAIALINDALNKYTIEKVRRHRSTISLLIPFTVFQLCVPIIQPQHMTFTYKLLHNIIPRVTGYGYIC